MDELFNVSSVVALLAFRLFLDELLNYVFEAMVEENAFVALYLG